MKSSLKTSAFRFRRPAAGAQAIPTRPRIAPRFGVRLLVLMALLGIGLALGVGGPDAASAQTPRLEAGLEALETETGTHVRFALHNRGDRPVQVLLWNTPLEGFRSRLFDVSCDGVTAPYRGPTVKRSEPGPSDYAVLDAGDSMAQTLDVAAAYDLPTGTSCRVAWRRDLRDARTLSRPNEVRFGGELRPYPLQALEVELRFRPAGKRLQSTAAFVGCDANEETVLRQALADGHTLSADARAYLQNVPTGNRPADPRYDAWFGTYDASRYGDVESLFGDVATASDATVTFDCTGSGRCGGVPAQCDPGDYAFTCSNTPGSPIWICGAFWTAPAVGENSRAGTVVHEISHWYGTDDLRYGCAGSLQLANESPASAVRNADNFEYFAENFGTTCP